MHTHLEVEMAANETMEADVNHRLGEGMKVMGALKNVWNERLSSRRMKMGMFEGIVVSNSVIWMQYMGC